MHAKIAFLYVVRFLIAFLKWIVSAIVVELYAILLSSPIVLGYLCVLNIMGKQATLLGGRYFLYWLLVSIVVFIPMFLNLIVRTIQTQRAIKKHVAQGNAPKKSEEVQTEQQG